MFESSQNLADEIAKLLEAIRRLGGGRYACLIEAKGVAFESGDPETSDHWMLRRFLEQRIPALFAIPEALATGGPAQDLFAEWEGYEFLLAFLNGRVCLVLACPDAEVVKEAVPEPLRALADRLLRFNPAWRVDAKGRGLFLGRPKLDLVVIGRARD